MNIGSGSLRARISVGAGLLTLAGLGAASQAVASLPGGGGSPPPKAPAPVPCHSIGQGKHDCSFWPAGDGITAGAPVQSSSGRVVGYLNQGTNWVICQQSGREQRSGRYHNKWWAWTEANDGRWGWVNAVWGAGGANDGKFRGVPSCRGRHGATPRSGPTGPSWPSSPGTVNYVALGDSYASGVSLGDYFGPPSCKRSRIAYAFLVHLSGERMHSHLVACSGATTSDVIKQGQLNALSRSTDLVTISVGGDDLGFSKLIEYCMLTDCTRYVNGFRKHVPGILEPKLRHLYGLIKARLRPSAKVIVLGYPRLFPDHPYKESFWCRNFVLVRMRADEQVAANKLAGTLRTVIGDAASAAGFQFIDSSSLFDGHDPCARDPYLNALIKTHPEDSYHPMESGHRAWASAIEGMV